MFPYSQSNSQQSQTIAALQWTTSSRRTERTCPTHPWPKCRTYLNYWQLIHDPKHSKLWLKLLSANEFGRLAQRVGRQVKGTNTIFFIHKDQVPKDRAKDVTYGSFICNMKPNKEEWEHTQLTAGWDRINYAEDVGMPTANMTLVKILLNSVISTIEAKYVMLDLKDFYLNILILFCGGRSPLPQLPHN